MFTNHLHFLFSPVQLLLISERPVHNSTFRCFVTTTDGSYVRKQMMLSRMLSPKFPKTTHFEMSRSIMSCVQMKTWPSTPLRLHMVFWFGNRITGTPLLQYLSAINPIIFLTLHYLEQPSPQGQEGNQQGLSLSGGPVSKPASLIKTTFSFFVKPISGIIINSSSNKYMLHK